MFCECVKFGRRSDWSLPSDHLWCQGWWFDKLIDGLIFFLHFISCSIIFLDIYQIILRNSFHLILKWTIQASHTIKIWFTIRFEQLVIHHDWMHRLSAVAGENAIMNWDEKQPTEWFIEWENKWRLTIMWIFQWIDSFVLPGLCIFHEKDDFSLGIGASSLAHRDDQRCNTYVDVYKGRFLFEAEIILKVRWIWSNFHRIWPRNSSDVCGLAVDTHSIEIHQIRNSIIFQTQRLQSEKKSEFEWEFSLDFWFSVFLFRRTQQVYMRLSVTLTRDCSLERAILIKFIEALQKARTRYILEETIDIEVSEIVPRSIADGDGTIDV
jgi:hypothetical protein